MRITYLVCYDIAEDKRRDQIFKICKNHGLHLQFSVFECDLNAMEFAGLQRKLGDVISQTEDQVLFVNLGPAEGRGERVITTLGRPYTKLDAPCYVV
jgi:CRISPR-associated protein Cas2